MSHALRTSRDHTELAFEVAALLGRHFGAEQAAYVEIDATCEYAVILRDWNDGTMASNAGRHRLEDFGPAFIADLKAGRSVAIGDVRKDPRTSSPEALASFASRGIRAVLNVPHLRAGRLAEGLAVHAREPRRWHPADVALAEEVVDRMSAALERARSEAALCESEARFREFGNASVDALWVRNSETLAWEYLSAAFTTIYGIERAEVVGERPDLGTLLDLVVPEDRERTAQAIRGLRDGPGEYEYRIRRPSDGQVRWLRTTGFPLVDADGHARRLGGITRDVTEARQAAERIRIIMAELQHRTHNIIAVIRAIAKRTQRTSASLDAFAESFLARLDALARANRLLSALTNGERVAFDDLLETELRAHGIVREQDAHLALSGPGGMRIRSASVQTLALALHELLTNATKHGALGRSDGHLAIERGIVPVEDKLRLRFEWRETWSATNGSDPPASAKIGFGRELIERAIPFQFRAETSYELRPDGLTCIITLPLGSA